MIELRYLMATLLFLAFAPPLLSQLPPGSSATPPAAKPAPRTQTPVAPTPPLAPLGALHFEPRTVEFGRISDTEEHTKTVKIRNTGSTAVTVNAVSSSCGCVVPTRPEKTSLAPGDEVEIPVKFNPLGRQGPERKTVFVESTDKAQPKAEFYVAAEVVPRIGIDPRIYPYREVKLGLKAEPQRFRFTLRDASAKLESITCDDKRFEIKELGQGEVEENGSKFPTLDYEVTFLGGEKVEGVRSWLQIKTNHPKMGFTQVPLVLAVVGPLRITPAQVGLRFDTGSKPFSMEIIISPREQGSFELTNPRVEGPAEMKLSVSNRGPAFGYKNSYRLLLEGVAPPTPDAAAGTKPIEGKIVFNTSTKEEPEVTIPITVTFTPPPVTPPSATPPANGPTGK